jgi:hypothetical protein
MPKFEAVDWSNPVCRLSDHFLVREAIWLPSWNRLANAVELTDEIKQNLFSFFNESMDALREWRKRPINVHVAFRPPEYNKAIGGAPHSYHMQGRACDFSFGDTLDCAFDIQAVRNAGILTTLDLRMENNETITGGHPSWIHIDNGDVGPSGRFFKP